MSRASANTSGPASDTGAGAARPAGHAAGSAGHAPHLARRVQWHRADRLHRGRIPDAARRWVLAEGSLTEHVRARCPGRFRLRVLRQQRSWPRADERRALGLARRDPVIVREVALCCTDTPMVVARTIIPVRSLRGRRQRLARMGTRPLGALLFADRSARRGTLEIARVTLRQAGVAHPPARCGPVWGRRAVFRLGGAPLLVSEFFLPALMDPAADSDATGAGG